MGQPGHPTSRKEASWQLSPQLRSDYPPPPITNSHLRLKNAFFLSGFNETCRQNLSIKFLEFKGTWYEISLNLAYLFWEKIAEKKKKLGI